MSTNSQTHCELIRNHLIAGKKITPIEALNFYQCMRLGARIYDLRKDGLNVQSEPKTLKNGKRVAQYFLLKQTIKEIQTCQELKHLAQQSA